MRLRFLVDETLAELAVHVANWTLLVDPARIAVGGGLMSSGDLILTALAHRLSFAAPFPPEVAPGRFLHDGALHGAIALVLDALDRGSEASAEWGSPATPPSRGEGAEEGK